MTRMVDRMTAEVWRTPSFWMVGGTPCVEGVLRMRGIPTAGAMLEVGVMAEALPRSRRQAFVRAFGPAALRRAAPGVFGHRVVGQVQNSRRPVGEYHLD